MTRVHLRKVKQFYYPKKLLFATCEPIYKKHVYPSSQHCSNLKSKEQARVHPYTQLLANEFINHLQTSPLIVYFHLNSLSRHQYRQARNAFIKSGFILERYDYEVAEVALMGTKFEILNSFYHQKYKKQENKNNFISNIFSIRNSSKAVPLKSISMFFGQTGHTTLNESSKPSNPFKLKHSMSINLCSKTSNTLSDDENESTPNCEVHFNNHTQQVSLR